MAATAVGPPVNPPPPQEGEALLQSLRRDDVGARFAWEQRTVVGRGTYGSVFRALCISPADTNTTSTTNGSSGTNNNNAGMPGVTVGLEYAVKVVDKLPHRNLRFLAHEIAVLQRVRSEHCVRLFDAFQGDGHVFLVLELVDGGELFTHIREQRRLSEADAAAFTRQLLGAVAQLHEEHIAHRDLKPENILVVKESKQIKLIDFGFAKFFGTQHSGCATSNHHNGRTGTGTGTGTATTTGGGGGGDRLDAWPAALQVLATNTSTGFSHFAPLSPNDAPDSPNDLLPNTPLGSLKYLAPEILQSLDRYGVRPRWTCRTSVQKIDVFAIGVVVYVMLSGCFPFRGDKGTVLSRHIEAGVQFPPNRFASVSPLAQDFCRLLLSPDRKRRPLATDALLHPWLTSTISTTIAATAITTHQREPAQAESETEAATLPVPDGDAVTAAAFDALRTAEQEADQNAAAATAAGCCLAAALPPAPVVTLRVPLGKKLRRASASPGGGGGAGVKSPITAATAAATEGATPSPNPEIRIRSPSGVAAAFDSAPKTPAASPLVG